MSVAMKSIEHGIFQGPHNRYYETFDEFREACETFFKNPHKYQRELRSLLTANFELIG